MDRQVVTNVYQAKYSGRGTDFDQGAPLLVHERVSSFDTHDRAGSPPSRGAGVGVFIGLPTETPWFLIHYTTDLSQVEYLRTEVGNG